MSYTTTITITHDDEADLVNELQDLVNSFEDQTIEDHELMDGTYQIGNCHIESEENEQNPIMEKIYELPFGVTVYVNTETKSGKILGTFDPDNKLDNYDTFSNGIESLILAHACAGIDISTPEYIEGIETVLDSLGNL